MKHLHPGTQGSLNLSETLLFGEYNTPSRPPGDRNVPAVTSVSTQTHKCTHITFFLRLVCVCRVRAQGQDKERDRGPLWVMTTILAGTAGMSILFGQVRLPWFAMEFHLKLHRVPLGLAICLCCSWYPLLVQIGYSCTPSGSRGL